MSLVFFKVLKRHSYFFGHGLGENFENDLPTIMLRMKSLPAVTSQGDRASVAMESTPFCLQRVEEFRGHDFCCLQETVCPCIECLDLSGP